MPLPRHEAVIVRTITTFQSAKRAVVRTIAVLALAPALVVLTGCSLPFTGGGSGCTNIQIDWVDFVEVGSTQFVAGAQSPATLQETDLGAVVAHVKFKVDGNVCDPNYKPKDGDAAFLDPGTAIYEVKGKPATTWLAARHNGMIVAYVALPTR